MAYEAPYQVTTKNGYDFYEVSSAFQKSIRRGLEDEAMYWGIELFESNFHNYAWKRMLIMVSEDIGLAEPDMPATIWSLYSIYKMLSEKKDTKHKPEKLQYAHAIILLAQARKSRMVDTELCTLWADWEKGTNRLEIPDWALDMHTRRGKKLGRGLAHFLEEGIKIENANPQPREKEFAEREKAHIFGDKGLVSPANDQPEEPPQQSLDI